MREKEVCEGCRRGGRTTQKKEKNREKYSPQCADIKDEKGERKGGL